MLFFVSCTRFPSCSSTTLWATPPSSISQCILKTWSLSQLSHPTFYPFVCLISCCPWFRAQGPWEQPWNKSEPIHLAKTPSLRSPNIVEHIPSSTITKPSREWHTWNAGRQPHFSASLSWRHPTHNRWVLPLPSNVLALGAVVIKSSSAENNVVGPEYLTARVWYHTVHGSGLKVHEN